MLNTNKDRSSLIVYLKQFVLISSPSHTGSTLFGEEGFLVNPGAHSHVYDPIVLLQT